MRKRVSITRAKGTGQAGYDGVFAVLREHLLSGQVRPGDTLLGERDLSAQLGVSRPVLREALRQLPGHQSGRRPGRKVLVRIDGAGATHQVLDWLTARRLSYSVGFGLPANTEKLLALLPKDVWQVA